MCVRPRVRGGWTVREQDRRSGGFRWRMIFESSLLLPLLDMKDVVAGFGIVDVGDEGESGKTVFHVPGKETGFRKRHGLLRLIHPRPPEVLPRMPSKGASSLGGRGLRRGLHGERTSKEAAGGRDGQGRGAKRQEASQ